MVALVVEVVVDVDLLMLVLVLVASKRSPKSDPVREVVLREFELLVLEVVMRVVLELDWLMGSVSTRSRTGIEFQSELPSSKDGGFQNRCTTSPKSP